METLTPQLPMVFGSFAAMLVAFLGLMNGTSPTTCLMKAMAAFLVFAGFGLILRYALTEAQSKEEERKRDAARTASLEATNGLDVIVPGTSVAELLASQNPDSGPGR